MTSDDIQILSVPSLHKKRKLRINNFFRVFRTGRRECSFALVTVHSFLGTTVDRNAYKSGVLRNPHALSFHTSWQFVVSVHLTRSLNLLMCLRLFASPDGCASRTFPRFQTHQMRISLPVTTTVEQRNIHLLVGLSPQRAERP
jgi:hypothetical protein